MCVLHLVLSHNPYGTPDKSVNMLIKKNLDASNGDMTVCFNTNDGL